MDSESRIDSNKSDDGRRRAPLEDPKHVLLAEDDADLRGLMATALRLDGFHVIESADGRELLNSVADWVLDRWPYEQLDLIVTDVRMPWLSGTDIIASLRRAYWDTPVIVVTAFADAALRTTARELGVSAVIEKPFDIEVLRATAARAVATRSPPTSE